MPDQLREIPRVRQIKGESRRRWFSASNLDLIVWVDKANRPSGFQLCHGIGSAEHALTWHPSKGFDYARVDSGEYGIGFKSTPILRMNGAPNLVKLRQLFESAADNVPVDIRGFVAGALSVKPPKSTQSKRRPSKK